MSKYQLPGKVFMAPMAGITDQPMRQIVYEKCGHKVIFVSEMVAVNALSRKNPKTYQIADVRKEPYPVIVQLEGSDPELFADAAALAVELGAAGIDINMGCPVRKVINGGAGSALMKDPQKAARVIRATVDAVRLPVSVKFRKGWDNNSINAVEFAKMCEDNGAAHIAVHGRTRAQGYSGEADWDIIADVKKAVKIPVIGNGDITSPQKAQEMLNRTGVDAVMIGRAILGAPWLPAKISDYLSAGNIDTEPSISEIKDTVLRHVFLLKQYYGEKLAVSLSRKYACWYSKNLCDAKRFREHYMTIDSYDEATLALQNYFEKAQWEKGAKR